MPNTRPLGKGTSDANRYASKKIAAANRFVRFLDSLDDFHPGEIVAVFDLVKAKLENNDQRMQTLLDLRQNARKVQSELGRIL